MTTSLLRRYHKIYYHICYVLCTGTTLFAFRSSFCGFMMKLFIFLSTLSLLFDAIDSFHVKLKISSTHRHREVGFYNPSRPVSPFSSALYSSAIADVKPLSAADESSTDGKRSYNYQVRQVPELGKLKAALTKVRLFDTLCRTFFLVHNYEK